ncbi:MAG: hypothetical protein ACK5Y2_13860 [Bdellovibrionales bacterium]
MNYIFALVSLVLALQTQAADPIRIEIGKSYDGYTNDELRRRVWQLEKAVSQLQDNVLQLAMNKGSAAPTKLWTCQIQSFGKTHLASGETKASALAQTLKKCSDATSAIHCEESDVSCGND